MSSEREQAWKFKHGHTTHSWQSPEYRSFVNARQRCTNPKHPSYSYYGGRGIEFRFRSFKEFVACAGERPEPKCLYTLDRINTNGHYEAGNVRWATRKEQQSNTRPNKGRFQNAKKTHCIRGHEFNQENTMIGRGRNGRLRRTCRICDRNYYRGTPGALEPKP